MKNVFEPSNDIFEDVSKDLTKTITETSKQGHKTVSDLNEKGFEILIDRCIKRSHLVSPLFDLKKPEEKKSVETTKKRGL